MRFEVRTVESGGSRDALLGLEGFGVRAGDGVVTMEAAVEAVLGVAEIDGADHSNDDETDGHADGAHDQERFAAEAVDGPDGGRGADEENRGLDALEHDGLNAGSFKNGGAEIHQRVNTSEHL